MFSFLLIKILLRYTFGTAFWDDYSAEYVGTIDYKVKEFQRAVIYIWNKSIKSLQKLLCNLKNSIFLLTIPLRKENDFIFKR